MARPVDLIAACSLSRVTNDHNANGSTQPIMMIMTGIVWSSEDSVSG